MKTLPGMGEVEEKDILLEYKKESINIFDYLNSIAGKKKSNLMRDTSDDEHAEKCYNPWIINIGLSNMTDTLLHANMINMNHHLPNRAQYEFLLNSIRPKNRQKKRWAKIEKNADLELICDYYSCNPNVGRQYLALLSEEQLQIITKRKEKGGLKK